jgi:Cu/Ag efflux protein CusF
MRYLLASCFVALMLPLPGCSPPPPQADSSEAETPPPVRSRGVVVAVTPEESVITIQHEPIPEYSMPAMTMEFTVADPSQLQGLDAGDRVSFALSGPIDIETIATDD